MEIFSILSKKLGLMFFKRPNYFFFIPKKVNKLNKDRENVFLTFLEKGFGNLKKY